MRAVPPVLSAALLCICSSALAADGPPLQVTVDAVRVTVRNVSAGGEAVLFTAQLEATGGLLRQRTGATRIADADRDSVIVFESPRPIPLRSIWVAVDIETGRTAIAGPDGYPLQIIPFPETSLKKDAEGILGVMDQERFSAELLVMRPRDGAWRLVGFEKNGKLNLASGDATPVGDSGPPPKRLKKGDVIAVIDPGRMEVFVTEIDK